MDIKGKGLMETFDLGLLEERCGTVRALLGLDGNPRGPAPTGPNSDDRRASLFRRFSLQRTGSVASEPRLTSAKKLSFSPIANLRIDDLNAEVPARPPITRGFSGRCVNFCQSDA